MDALELNHRDMDNYVFISVTNRDKKWTDSGVRKTMERINKALNTNVTCHSFRRYAATELSRQGYPIERIMRYLGHNSPRTTEVYIDRYCSDNTADCVETLDFINSNPTYPRDVSEPIC